MPTLNNVDAFVFLSNDHRALEALFTKLEGGSRDREEVIEQLITELSVHSQIEEDILYPAVRRRAPNGRRLADHAVEEHQKVAEMLDRLAGMDPGDPEVDALVRELHTSVQEHFHEEQGPGGLFATLRESMEPDELREMGSQLAQAKLDATVEPLDDEEKPPVPKDIGGSMFVIRSK